MTAKTVAVTGAAGFLGRHITMALAQEGAKIRILARRPPAPDFCPHIQFETIPGSLETPTALAALVQGADAIIHAAGLISAPNRAIFLAANRDGSAALAQAARRHAPQSRFIAVSTLAARKPEVSDYAFSKRAGEEAIRTAYTGAEQHLTIIRPPALYGPWDRSTLPIFQAAALPIIPILSRGRATVLHVTDAATAIARAAIGAATPGLFALSGGDHTLAEIMTAAACAQGRHGRPIHIPPLLLRAAAAASGLWGRLRRRTPVFGPAKAREFLHPDWIVQPHEALPCEALITLADGFTATVAWYRAAKWLR